MITIEEHYADDPSVLARIAELKPLAEAGDVGARYELVGWAALAAFDRIHEAVNTQDYWEKQYAATGARGAVY